ncbi:MAG: hypothetical protein ACR2N3_05625 [Pyrinomonadaceae bacterium]
MKKQINKRQQPILLATIATIIMLGAFGSTFAQSVGAPYGAREPRTCADTKAPTKGAITAAQATKYVICNQEGVSSDLLYLVENVQVTVGGGRPYNSFSDSYATSIDTTAPVYPIRGSFDKYQCSKVTDTSENKGYNCNIYHERKAEGKCFKTTFGDWYCNMQDTSNNDSDRELDMPPPGGAKAVAPAKDKPAAAKNGNQTADNRAGADDNKDEGGLPKPDFSEMEKYFDISKAEYADGYLYFNGKMTKKNNAVDWQIDFYDADGIKVIPTNGINPKSGDYYEVGDIAKYYGYLPPESKWKFVKKVVITRKIY